MSAQPDRNPLRDEVLALRHREREIRDELAALTAELEHNEAEQRRLKHLLVTNARVHVPASTHYGARRMLFQMGSFTVNFAAKRLGWTTDQLKELLNAMEYEKPPSIEAYGRYGRELMFRYVGPPIDDDPAADAAAAEYEALRTWALTQTTTFTPPQGAAACNTKKSTALQAFRLLQETGALEDCGPTRDMPIFRVVGVTEPPTLTVVPDRPRVTSKVPQMQQLLDACYKSEVLTVAETEKHYAVTNLEGTRAVFDKKPPSREEMLQLRGRLRRMGAKL